MIPPYPLAWPDGLPRTPASARQTSRFKGLARRSDRHGERRCVAVDRYTKVEHNLQAIHHILEARRTEVRHGGLVIARSAFRGFVALPAPPGRRQWNEILGVPEFATVSQITEAYREKAKRVHPDAGGTEKMMQELNEARDLGLKHARGKL